MGLVVGGAMSGGATLASPFGASAADVAARYAAHDEAFRLAALLQFGAAVPLGIFAATVYSRQLRLGIRVPGPSIGFYGGVFAAVFLGLSGLITWTAAQAGVASDAVLTHALAYLAFATGGVGFAVGLGLLVAGAAVPALVLRLVPRWLAWTGLVLAAVGELTFFSLVITPLEHLLPIARFGGLIWLIAYGFLLPHTRHEVARVTPAVRPAAHL
ncbi:hypothetical protein ACPPVS_01455 [Cellulomonas sp. McL0617]|uniref:hypothetical protein n=1 Tax=Cellulomonas sp. McL0617 TaxID=3415675 RepID=UPI003CEE867D